MSKAKTNKMTDSPNTDGDYNDVVTVKRSEIDSLKSEVKTINSDHKKLIKKTKKFLEDEHKEFLDSEVDALSLILLDDNKLRLLSSTVSAYLTAIGDCIIEQYEDDEYSKEDLLRHIRHTFCDLDFTESLITQRRDYMNLMSRSICFDDILFTLEG